MEKKLGVAMQIYNYRDISVPIKVRKISCLYITGLPIGWIQFFSRDQVDELVASITSEKKEIRFPFIIRVACIPDKSSMPTVYVESNYQEGELRSSIDRILNKDSSITHLILQQATPKDAGKDKISGRVLFEDSRSSPREILIEFYKGSRSTGILNNLSVQNPNYLRFEKFSGRLLVPVSDIKESFITQFEVRELLSRLHAHSESFVFVRDIVRTVFKRMDEPVSIEFSFRGGNLLFTDID